MTKDEIVLAAKCCIADKCGACPLIGSNNCITDFMKHILGYIKENEPAPAATGTSSEVSQKEDTASLAHIDDSTLLDICQAAFVEVVERSGGNYSSGYAQAIFDVIRKVRGGDGNEH